MTFYITTEKGTEIEMKLGQELVVELDGKKITISIQ